MALRPGIKVADRFEIRRLEREAPAYQAARAFDDESKTEVSLWVVRPELLATEAARARFVEDAQRARAFFHPNVRRVFAGGDDPRGGWVALPILQGETLADRIRAAQPMPEPELVKLARALGDGLEAASQVQLVHGRLLPADLRLAEVPKIAGVGLWSALDPAAARAAFRAEIRYIAPEVRAGQQATTRSDVYSVAVILGELALGSFLDGSMVHDTLRERLRRHRPALVKVLGAALAQEPAARPLSVAELAGRLGHDVGARPAEPGAGAAPPGRHGAPADPLALAGAGGEVPPLRPQIAKAVATPPSERPPQRGNGAPPPPAAVAASAPPERRPGSGRPSSPTVFLNAGKAPRLGDSMKRPAVRPPRPLGFHVAIALACALATAGIAWVAYTLATSRKPEEHAPARPAQPSPSEVPLPPKTEALGDTKGARPSACPPDMLKVDETPAFCIDTFEEPGQGIIPVTNVTLEQARVACGQRGRRLCTSDEWELACRGSEGLFYPYGKTFEPKRCNVREAGKRQVQAAGTWPECRSSLGAADLSGNVSEWIEEGMTKGGSTLDGEDGRCSRAMRRKHGLAAPDIGYRCCAGVAR